MRWLALLLLAATGVVPVLGQTTTTLVDTTTTTFLKVTTTTVLVTTTTVTLASTSTTTTTTATLASTSTTTTTTTTLATPGECAACDDGNPCTTDSCGPAFVGCTHRPIDGAPCADDGVFCTRDRCQDGVCQHVPADSRCDRGDCAVRACRPGDNTRDRIGCVKLEKRRKRDGTRCTSDGFSCTDDVCARGACMHMPVDARCAPGGVCRTAACSPTRPGHDAAGCVVGPEGEEGSECVEDGNVCTRDVCRSGLCEHESDGAERVCSPVQGAFERTAALGNMAGELGGAAADLGGEQLEGAHATLTLVQAQLDIAAAVLAGRLAFGPTVAGQAADSPGIPADLRARIAFTTILRTPEQVSRFLSTVAEAQARQALRRPAARYLRTRGRMLLRSTRGLRAELRRLRRLQAAAAIMSPGAG